MTCNIPATKSSLGHDGTFEFCGSCPAEKNCCSRVNELGEIAPPFLIEREAEAIESALSVPRADFAEYEFERPDVKSLKVKDGTCYFYNRANGHCAIYSYRPLDCRIFPFDIVKSNEGKFNWILYIDLCPKKFRIEEVRDLYFGSVKRLFSSMKLIGAEIDRIAVQSADIMQRHKYVVLEEVCIDTLNSAKRRGKS